MGTLVRLRVALPDRPGALARVAGTIGEQAVNIVSVDVHRAGVVSAVDDFVLDLPEGCDLGRLRTDLEASGLATVLCQQDAQNEDLAVTVLHRATDMLTTASADGSAALIRGVEKLCQSPVVWVNTIEESISHDAGRFALEGGGAIALRTSKLPAEFSDRMPGEVWLLAVPDPTLSANGRMVFVARPLSNEFTNTEIARVEALMAFQDQLDRMPLRL